VSRVEETGGLAATMRQKSPGSRRQLLPVAAGRQGAGKNLLGSRARRLRKALNRGGEDLPAGGVRSSLRIKSRAGALVPVVAAAQKRRLQGKLETAPGVQRVPPPGAGRPVAGAGLAARRAGPKMEPAARAGAAPGVRALHEEENLRPARRLPARRRTRSGRSW